MDNGFPHSTNHSEQRARYEQYLAREGIQFDNTENRWEAFDHWQKWHEKDSAQSKKDRATLERYFAMVSNSEIRTDVYWRPYISEEYKDVPSKPHAKHDLRRKRTKKERGISRYNPRGDGSVIQESRWDLKLPSGSILPVMLASGYLQFTDNGTDWSKPFEHMESSTAPLFYEAVESARIANLSGKWHNYNLLQAVGEVGKKWHVFHDSASMSVAAVWAVAHNIAPYDMLPVEYSDAAAFAKFFEMNIAVAVNDSDGGAAVQLALEMAVQHELSKPPPPPPPPEPPEPPPPGDGTGEGTGRGQGATPENDAGADEDDTLNHPDSDGDGDSEADGADTDDVTVPDFSITPIPEPEPAPEQTMEERYTEIKENIAKDFEASQKKALRRDKNRIKNITNANSAEAALGNAQLSFVGDHRIVIYPEPEQERFNMPSHSVDIPASIRGMSTSYRYTGTVSNKTWQMAIGNMRTFSRTTQSRPKIGVLMDISGSMGCACNACANSVLEHSHSVSDISHSGTIGYAVAGAVSELDPDAVIATYAGTDEIYRIKPGHVLTHSAYSATGGATPTCVALEWLEKSMAEDLSNAFCLLITDGYPNVCSGGFNPQDHTNAIAWRMHESGVQFGVVIVGRYSANITANLPPTVTVNISTLGELDKLQEIVNAITD